MALNEIAVPQAPETQSKAIEALSRAEMLRIVDDMSLLSAGNFREGLKEIGAEIDRTFDDTIAAAFKAHKTAVAAKKRYSEPLEEALKIIKQKMIVYTNEQEQKRRLDQARLEKEAREKAEADAMELASMLEAAGAHSAADQVISEPIQPAPVILAPAVPKVAGFSKRKIYTAVVINKADFLNGIASGRIPIEAVEPNQQFLNSQAAALKEALVWPGVHVSYREV